MLRKIIKARFNHIIDLFDLTNEINHKVEKGGFREYFISELIRPLIPPHFGIGNGIIVDVTGRQSTQIDVLIFDKRRLQPIFQADNRGIYPIDIVMAIIEIKTKLTAGDLRTLQETATSFVPFRTSNSFVIATLGTIPIPDSPGGYDTKYPLYSIFAYTSDARDKPESLRIKEQCDRNSWQGFRLIGIADKGIWGFNDNTYDFDSVSYSEGDFILVYLKGLLSRLEDTANSRGDFGLQYWI